MTLSTSVLSFAHSPLLQSHSIPNRAYNIYYVALNCNCSPGSEYLWNCFPGIVVSCTWYGPAFLLSTLSINLIVHIFYSVIHYFKKYIILGFAEYRRGGRSILHRTPMAIQLKRQNCNIHCYSLIPLKKFSFMFSICFNLFNMLLGGLSFQIKSDSTAEVMA